MSKRQTQRRLAWWIAAGMTAVLMAIILIFADIHFAVNDDTLILRAFMGYENGTPATVHIYLHGLLAGLLGGLGKMFPAVPWYTWMLLALTAAALWVIAKSLMQCFVNRDKPLWMGAVTALAFLIGFGVEYTVVCTFTQTAAFLGTAAVLQLMSTDFSKRKGILLSFTGAAVLAGLTYALRQSAVLPVIALCGLAFIDLLWEHRPPVRSVLASLGVIVLVLGGLLGFRQLELSSPRMKDYLDWQEANGYLFDYYGLDNLTQEDMEAAGWSESMYELAWEWCFLDSDLNTESFHRMTEVVQQKEPLPLMERVQKAKDLLLLRASRTKQEYRILLAAAGLAFAGCGLGALFQKGSRLRLLFTLTALAAGCGVMILYLALQGRVPLRAILTVALPAVAMLWGLLPSCLPDRRISTAVLAVLCAGLLVFSVQHTDRVKALLWKSIRGESAASTAYTDAEAYALQHPDCLLILHSGVAGDVNAFPDYSQGMPHNVTSWGNWSMRSPENAELFARFGIDIWHFDPSALLREDVLFVTQGENGADVLLKWLQEEISPEIAFETIDVFNRISVLRFIQN